jgi:DNA-binding HxlR family transcriptional regulator
MPASAYCPVSLGTRLIGDRWSLLIVREMLVGASRFNAIHRGLPGLSRSLLSSRLRYLERIGVVDRLASEGHANRTAYRLTDSGLSLRPVLVALGAWTLDWQLPPSVDGELSTAALLWHMHQGLDRSMLPKTELTIGFRFPRSKPSGGWIRVGEFESGACIGSAEHEVDLTVVVEPKILNELWWGKRACAAAIAAGDVGFEGPAALASAYPTWFRPPARAA